MHIAASNPLSIDSDGIDSEILKKEQELVSEELKNSGKPDDIVKKILDDLFDYNYSDEVYMDIVWEELV